MCDATRTSPLSPALSPEYRGEGVGAHNGVAVEKCRTVSRSTGERE